MSPESRGRFPQVPRTAVDRMKDIATHPYHGILVDLVWMTAMVRVPLPLRLLK